MTDELRSQPTLDAPGGAPGPARSRRPYARPELTAFGSVRDLTRGASGTAKDGSKKRKPGKPG